MINKKIILFPVLSMLLVSTNSCGKKMSDEEYFKNHFNPVVRFIVTSDAHISSAASPDKDVGAKKLSKMYQVANDYAKTQPFSTINHAFVVGDGSDDYSTNSMQKFWNITKEAESKYGIKTSAIMGNHEFAWQIEDPNPETAIANWKNVTNQELDFSFTINGYHFIMFSLHNGNNSLYDDVNQSRWLEGEIQKALNDDSSKSKPIFVFQHVGVKDTCYGTAANYMQTKDETLGKIPAQLIPKVLKKYPQVVDFSGHSHFPLTDPRAVMQTEFTSVATGTLDDVIVDLAGVCDNNIHALDKDGTGGYIYSILPMRTSDDGNYFLICEADNAGALKITPYNLEGNYAATPWLFRSFKSTADFKYTIARRNLDPRCEFQNVSISVPEEIGMDFVRYSIPQAKYAQHYRCEIYENGNYLKTVYRLCVHWFTDVSPIFTIPINSLKPNTNYQLKIAAVNSWGQETYDNYNLSFKTTR